MFLQNGQKRVFGLDLLDLKYIIFHVAIKLLG
jgi:hypothetical protein